MLSQCLESSIAQKNYCLFDGSGTTTTKNYKIFSIVFQHILKPLETFLIRIYFHSNAKKYKRQKRPGQILI